MSIFGIGTVVIDHVVVLPVYPEQDTKSYVRSHLRQIGGPVPVALSTASFYGARTHFMGRWGNDVDGHSIRNGLGSRHIDVSPSESRDDWSTGFAHVWTEEQTGARTIACHRGSFPNPGMDDLTHNLSTLDTCQILHLDGALPDVSLVAAQRAKDRGLSVVLDAGSKKPGMEELLPLVDVVVASDLFCKSWFGEASVPIHEIHSLGPNEVVRTLAERGAIYSDGSRMIERPGIKIRPVDTNGAGDIFCGAWLFAMSQGWDVDRRLRFANFVAGHACLHIGNSTYPDIDEFTLD